MRAFFGGHCGEFFVGVALGTDDFGCHPADFPERAHIGKFGALCGCSVKIARMGNFVRLLHADFEDRAVLYDRIDRRAAKMFEDGLVGEVRTLLDAGVPLDGTAMQAIGYKETAAYLRGECTLPEAVDVVQRKSRQYAKRQLTWLRRDERVRWLRWKNEPDLTAARQISTDFVGKAP